MTDDRIDIKEEVFTIIYKLGLDPDYVKRIELEPTTAKVTCSCYLRDENGAKYLIFDDHGGASPAVEELIFRTNV